MVVLLFCPRINQSWSLFCSWHKEAIILLWIFSRNAQYYFSIIIHRSEASKIVCKSEKLELPLTTTHSPAKRPDSKQQESQHTVRIIVHSKQQEPPKRLTALATPSSSRPTEILVVNYHIIFSCTYNFKKRKIW